MYEPGTLNDPIIIDPKNENLPIILIEMINPRKYDSRIIFQEYSTDIFVKKVAANTILVKIN